MNRIKNKYLSIISLILLTIVILTLPPIIIISMAFASASIASYLLMQRTMQRYDINYKYWFSFAGQLGALIFVSACFVTGLSFIANGIAP